MKNPNELCTRAMATTILIAIANAAIRVRNPRINPRPPKNSAAIAKKANGAGICNYPVKRFMDPEKPGPPYHPNSFCAPCAKKTIPSTSLKMAVALLSSVTSNLPSIFDLLSLVETRKDREVVAPDAFCQLDALSLSKDSLLKVFVTWPSQSEGI